MCFCAKEQVAYWKLVIRESTGSSGRNFTSRIICPHHRVHCCVALYMHDIVHNLKKIAGRVDVSVVFSAPQKPFSLCNSSVPRKELLATCSKKHRCTFVRCIDHAAYRIPLHYGKFYISQSARCLNDRLREHRCNVQKHKNGHPAMQL